MKRLRKAGKVNKVTTPIDEAVIRSLRVGDQIEIQGKIYCGRDAVLPKLVSLCEAGTLDHLGVDLKGTVIFHTAVSPAGIGPTTSNKLEIEGSMPVLSRAGVKIHLGKGSLSMETVKALKKNNSLFAITPPVSALFMGTIVTQRVAAFKEEGMEALYELEVKSLPAIIAIAHGETIFSEED
mgnify:CR=1 FL=1